MAKFNIEVELDWMDEEAYSIDDELRERIVEGVENALLEKATNEAVKAVDNKIAEKILEAEETIQATVDQFIANVCEEKIGKIVIPEKKSTWSDEVTYKPLSEYVGERFELFLTEKRYDRDGRIASYSSDRKLSAAGLLTSQYLEEELGKKVEKLIATCRQCGRRILWVRMRSGKNMPVDMALHNYKKDSTGKEKIVTPDGEVVTGRILVGERGDGAGYISHFASCKKYRR